MKLKAINSLLFIHGNLRAIKQMGMEIQIVYLRSDGSRQNINSLVGL
jgi:hypothetical protein